MKLKISLFLFFLLLFSITKLAFERRGLEIVYNNLSQQKGTLQVFWDSGDGFKESNSKRKTIEIGQNRAWFNFPLFKYPKKIRIDFFEKKNLRFKIQSIYIKYDDKPEYIFNKKDFKLDQLDLIGDEFVSQSNDPKIILSNIKTFNFFDNYFFASILFFFGISFLNPQKKGIYRQ